MYVDAKDMDCHSKTKLDASVQRLSTHEAVSLMMEMETDIRRR